MLIYNLQPKQLEFAYCRAKYRLYGGAKGGGKSFAMRSECVRQAKSLENVKGLVLRRTFPEVRKNALYPMLSELPEGSFNYNASEHVIRFPNGSSIEFSYCRNYKDVLRYQGIEYDFICIEELTHWTEEEFKILKTCLRSPRAEVTPNFFGSTNPSGVGHGWVKRLFINRQFEKGEKPQDYAFIPAQVYDNKVLMESQPEYIEDLEDLPDKLRRAYLGGDWDIFEGQYFPEFNRDVHVIDPIIPKGDFIKRRIVAVDYGYSAPSCALWLAQDTQDNVICYRELYETGLTYEMLAKKIQEMTTEDEDCRPVIVDPAIVAKPSEETGTSGGDILKKAGLKVKGADNARLKGWMTVRNYLRTFKDPNTNELTAKLKISSNCANLIRTLPEQIHDDTNVEDLYTKGEDHAVDTVRYGLVELSVGNASLSEVREVNKKLQKGETQAESTKTSSFWKPPSSQRKTLQDVLIP